VVIVRQGHDIEATVGEPQADSVITVRAGVILDPGCWVFHRPALAERARENHNRQVRNGDRFGFPKEMYTQVRLVAKPGVSVPDATGDKRIVIARDDEDRA
jgi:hypothetical protein